MRMRKRKFIGAFVMPRGSAGGMLGAAVGAAAVFALSFIIGGGTLGEKLMDRYLGRNRAYAEAVEIFKDPQGRVSAIMGGYTYLVSEKPSPAPTEPAPSQTPPPQVQPEPVKVTESTSQSLAEVKNLAGKSFDADALAASPLAYKIDKDTPQVLIVHTHTTESYFEQDRSVDETKNMTAVGNVIAQKLEEGGIPTVHDITVHDYPSYNNAYTRAAATTKNRLAENPGIKIVLDVHRDAVAAADGSKLKLACDINGEKSAQVMFVVGTDAQLTHEYWQENLKLALKLQRMANEMYPGLMRPINLREQRFNQQLSKGSIIIEVGTNGNTLDEAKKGAELIANVLVEVLTTQNQ